MREHVVFGRPATLPDVCHRLAQLHIYHADAERARQHRRRLQTARRNGDEIINSKLKRRSASACLLGRSKSLIGVSYGRAALSSHSAPSAPSSLAPSAGSFQTRLDGGSFQALPGWCARGAFAIINGEPQPSHHHTCRHNIPEIQTFPKHRLIVFSRSLYFFK